jgi:hypothetical protein
MTITSPYATGPYQRGPLSRRFLPLGLITLGVVFLLANFIPSGNRSGLVVLGLGAAFLLGRVATGRYGYAVPAGILIALGTYLSLHDAQGPRQLQGGGWFFALLGLGFGLVYLIGLRPSAVWPLFPAAILLGLSLVLFGVGSLGVLASMSWIIAYWPLALVLLGLWLMFRDHLPLPLRRPIATLGGLALLAYGVLAAAASVATGGELARTDLAAGFGSSPFAETITLDAPITAGQTFNVDNSSGPTTVRAGTSSNVHVVATKHYSVGGKGMDVRLTPDASGVSLSTSNPGRQFPFGLGGSSGWVEYAIEVPATVNVNAKSGSGQIEVDDISGAVQAQSGSGAVHLTNLSGSADARSSSGAIELDNLAGDVRVSTSSGQIRGTDVRHIREATSSSGAISLAGSFTDATKIQATSGSVNLKLSPASAVQLDVKTGSGSIVPQGLTNLSGGSTQRNRLTGALGAPAPGAVLSVETNSGSIQISQ